MHKLIAGLAAGLALLVAAPLAVALLWRRLWLAVPAVLALMAWQWQPAFDGMTAARSDPSLQPSYYDGLLDVVSRLPPTRIEIPFTRRHWEAARVAPHVAMARGWERQIDIGLNPLFYPPAPALTAAKHASSESNTRAGPRCTVRSWPASLTAQPSGARLP